MKCFFKGNPETEWKGMGCGKFTGKCLKSDVRIIAWGAIIAYN